MGNATSNVVTPRVGAVGFLDVLGFKGIWQRHEASAIVERLRTLHQVLASPRDELEVLMEQLRSGGWSATGVEPGRDGNIPFRCATIFISDSVLITSAVKTPLAPGLQDAELPTTTMELYRLVDLVRVATQVSEALRHGAMGDPALIYRGCVTYGDFYHDERFVIGKAIDDAVALEHEAEGGFCYLAPSALRIWSTPRSEGLLPAFNLPNLFVPTVIPIKNGGHFKTLAVNPFWSLDLTEFANLRSAYNMGLTSVGDALDIECKRQNTLEFLAIAEDAEREYRNEHSHTTANPGTLSVERFEV